MVVDFRGRVLGCEVLVVVCGRKVRGGFFFVVVVRVVGLSLGICGGEFGVCGSREELGSFIGPEMKLLSPKYLCLRYLTTPTYDLLATESVAKISH